MTSHKSKGFSLIELMIAVAIVAALAAIAYPSYIEQVANGRRSECRSGLLQAMQQQERYFTQFNRYVLFTSATVNPPIKSFSADNANSSACAISAVVCSPTGSTEAQCVELRATMNRTDPANITYLYSDSDGNKGCAIGATRTTTSANCWR
jgi:type IV pilus assembly protein PilE